LELDRRLSARIRENSHYLWNDSILKEDVERWLKNFTGSVTSLPRERILGLYILSKYVYVPEREIRFLCREAYRLLLHALLEANTPDPRAEVTPLIRRLVDSTKFYHLGGPGESGGHILYMFRQENELPLRLFLNPAANSKRIGTLCVLDDMSLTGDQATKYRRALSRIKSDRVFFLFLIVSSAARRKLETAGYTVISALEIDDSEMSLRPRSALLMDAENDLGLRFSVALIRRFCREYGKQSWPVYPLGYGDGALALGLHHNVPDNSLPILWSETNWIPIVTRHHKTEEGEVEERRPFI
jgi:hypothetical protein